MNLVQLNKVQNVTVVYFIFLLSEISNSYMDINLHQTQSNLKVYFLISLKRMQYGLSLTFDTQSQICYVLFAKFLLLEYKKLINWSHNNK